MTVWRIEAETTGHEVYVVEAPSEDAAWDRVLQTGIEPIVSEVLSVDITSIRQEPT